ncbi:MAG: rhodanese-like domain-containing protein [Methylovulum sp.]|jgi:rhodanese-related sulfurtransferase|nr:rhodanese-like domain-containing protein [Methylovulum sp.]
MIEQWLPLTAWEFIKNTPNALLLDVRTKAEYDFVGHPLNAVLIPWKELPDWQSNELFLPQVEAIAADRHIPILLLCRSGQRSLEAAKMLEQAGYVQLINIMGGFEGALNDANHRSTLSGWRFSGLPWQQT